MVAAAESNLHSYTFREDKPENGRNYYRLRQVDIIGKTSYSKVKSLVLDGSLAASLNPNPVKEGSTLSISSKMNDIVLVQIFNSTGMLIWKQEVNVPAGKQQLQLPVSKLSPGSYLIFISSGTGRQLRFVK